MEKLKMCIFADIHYIDKKPEWKFEQKLIDYAEPFTNQMIEKINNEIKPDICIFLGDMIQASKNKNVDIKNIKYIWNKLQEIRVPFYTLLGNHELKMVESNKEILDIIGYERATFSINMKDYHLLFIGTDVNLDDVQYKTQYLSSEDLSFIENDLKLNKNKRTIIFSHFGIAEDNMKDNFWFEKNIEGGMLRNRNELKVILKNQKNILAIFCGHQHWTKKLMENDVMVDDILLHNENRKILSNMGIKDRSTFYRKHFCEPTSPFYLSTTEGKFSVEYVSDVIKKSCGKRFLAHPFVYGIDNLEEFLDFLVSKKLIDGIECYHRKHNPEQINWIVEYCNKHNLLKSGGSDKHTEKHKIGYANRGNIKIKKELINNWVNNISFFE